MNKNVVIALVLAALLVLGFMMLSKNKQPSTSVVEEITQTETGDDSMANQLEVTLAEQNESGETGTATLVGENGQVIVTLSMQSFPEDTPQPAHIHVGSCPNVGVVKYPLTSVVNGESTTLLEVTLAQLENELPLGINIHKSVPEAGVYTACGDLTF